MQFSLKYFYRKAHISKNIIRINSHFFLNKKTLSVYNISKPSSLISLNNYNNSRELFDFNVLKLNLAGSGFKDKIYQKLCPIIDFCITHQIKLEWDEDMGIYGNWSDYFLSIDQTIKFNNITLSNRKVKIFSPTWSNNDTDFLLHILENYNSNYINEIYRFTPSTRSQIDKNIKGLNLKKNYVAVQVRRGDKITSNQIQNITPKDVLNKLPWFTKQLFIATDDYTFVEELRTLNKKLDIVTTALPSHRGADEGNTFNSNTFNTKIETLRFLIDIEVCKRATFFIQVIPENPTTVNGKIPNLLISYFISHLRGFKSVIKLK